MRRLRWRRASGQNLNDPEETHEGNSTPFVWESWAGTLNFHPVAAMWMSGTRLDSRKKKILLVPRHCGLIVLLLVVYVQVGCAARRPLVRAPQRPTPKLTTVEDAKGLLVRNYGNADSVKASGEIETRLSNEEHWRRASFALMLERPDKLRVRAYRPLMPALFELVYDGQTCWLFVPSEKAAYRSEKCEAFRVGDSHMAVSADALIEALFVVADFDAFLTLPAFLYREGDSVRLVIIGKAGAYKEIWIDSMTGLATRQLLVDSGGTLEAEINYKEHALDENNIIPVEIEIGLLPIHASIVLRIQDFQLDPEFPDGAFDFSPPRNTKVFELHGVNRDSSLW
jgi:outer membrane lipoprotein-sorting protein